jgi:hypothetical protein
MIVLLTQMDVTPDPWPQITILISNKSPHVTSSFKVISEENLPFTNDCLVVLVHDINVTTFEFQVTIKRNDKLPPWCRMGQFGSFSITLVRNWCNSKLHFDVP